MKNRRLPKKFFFKPDEWKIVENEFTPEQNLHRETIFSLGNGYMAMRGTFEEGFSGNNTKPTTFIAGIFDFDKFDTVVTRGKDVMPRQSQNMANYPDLFNIKLFAGNESFDMLKSKFKGYKRTLDLKNGVLNRRLTWIGRDKRETEINIDRIVCLDNFHVAAIRYRIKPLNYTGKILLEISSGKDRISGSEKRKDATKEGTGNYLEMSLGKNRPSRSEQWKEVTKKEIGNYGACVSLETNHSGFKVASAMDLRITSDGKEIHGKSSAYSGDGCITRTLELNVKEGTEYCLEKIVSLHTSRDKDNNSGTVEKRAIRELRKAGELCFDRLLKLHSAAWRKFWADNDIIIQGDAAIQQGVRFCLFQLNQAYRGDDPNVNIGCKGLAGGGPYFWDTEMYLLPFFIYTNPKAARNLLLYRYHTLAKARDIAKTWGYAGAKFPWMTLNGADIPQVFWECVIGEIHINTAVSYGIWHYVQATGDKDFLVKYGAEILIEIARFWADRVAYNKSRRRYVINQVTGPDEYTPMVNNNCYTNSTVQFSLEYTHEVVESLKKHHRKAWKKLSGKISFNDQELKKWKDIIKKMYIPFDKKLRLHPQDDTFMTLDHINLKDIPDDKKPLEENNWPLEKIMRHDVIKQADVVLLIYLLNNRYSLKVKKNDYEFYEPKTTHDSSLSPSIHSIIANEIGKDRDAYYYALRSARLDLDNYNKNTEAGIHTCNTSGAWMTVVNGFGGMRLREGQLCFNPKIPAKWQKYAFNVTCLNRTVGIEVSKNRTIFYLKRGEPIEIKVKKKSVFLEKGRGVLVRN